MSYPSFFTQHSNIGWLYNKAYYAPRSATGKDGLQYPSSVDEPLTKEGGNTNTQYIREMNERLLNIEVEDFAATIERHNRQLDHCANTKLKLKVDGRGFLTGTGLRHEMGITEEYKMGLYFDSVTGLPFIPGSSVKGGLRAHFKKLDYLKAILAHCGIQLNEGCTPEQLENYLFEGKVEGSRLAPYAQCHFIGACLSKAENQQKGIKLFRRDAIGVKDIEVLFQTLLAEQGLGAKKNYDFGKFVAY